MQQQRTIVVKRDCPARLVPVGTPITINKNTFVNLKQALGGTFTVTVNGNMARIDGTDADAIGMEGLQLEFPENTSGEISEDDVWYALKTVYDPEMPVSIVDLGLIYDVKIKGKTVHIQMTLTAPGCGMAEVLVGDVRYRVAKAPNVEQVEVELVFDPPWSREMISDEARLELGIF